MYLKFFRIVGLIFVLIIMNFRFNNAVCETSMQDIIKDGDVKRYEDFSLFIIKFSTLIFEKDGKELKIPIFQGNSSDVHYKEFLKYCYKNNLLKEGWGESAFIIPTEKGKLTKTFHEFLKFYKNNILKNTDVSKPAKIIADGGALELYYDFEVNSIPFVLQIIISTGKNEIDPETIQSIFDVNLDEKMKVPMFRYRFWKNKTSKKF